MALVLAVACRSASVTPDALEVARPAGAVHLAGGVAAKKHRWTHGQIPYTFAPDLPNVSRARVDSAIARIQARVFGITFKPRTSERDYILFRPSDDCMSRWKAGKGRVGGVVGETCGTVV